jgi:ribonuclease P/MRP protein subunit POP5
MKGKPLLPVLRTKKRYVVYEALSEKKIMHKEIAKAIMDSFRKNFGIFGLGYSGIMDTGIFKENKGILKVNNKYLDKLRSSLVMIKTINGNEVIVRTFSVSGILKKAKIILNN